MKTVLEKHSLSDLINSRESRVEQIREHVKEMKRNIRGIEKSISKYLLQLNAATNRCLGSEWRVQDKGNRDYRIFPPTEGSGIFWITYPTRSDPVLFLGFSTSEKYYSNSIPPKREATASVVLPLDIEPKDLAEEIRKFVSIMRFSV